MGMYFSDLKKMDQKYIASTYARMQVDAQQGNGAQFEDLSGKQYIDFSSGIGVNALGFTNPAWVAAVTEQVQKLAHISNLYYTQPQVALAKALCERTGAKRVFFSNSGAEANECAIKTARKYGADQYGPHRCEIVTLVNSFHGRTIATLAATGQDVFHKNFGPFPAGFSYARANDIADLKAKVGENTCAVMLECIQGEGGVIPLEADYLAAVAELCSQQDILLIVDEVQTGVGRTGKFLCSQYFGLQPDIVTLAKGLGGGLPIGAALLGEKVQNTLGFGDHGSTFGGNPVSCAGAIAVLESVTGKFLDDIIEKGYYLTKKFLHMDGVTDVSGKGLMLGVTLQEGLLAREIAADCAKEGLITLTAKHKLRFLPPLTIEYEEMDAGLAILQEVLAKALQKQEQEEGLHV